MAYTTGSHRFRSVLKQLSVQVVFVEMPCKGSGQGKACIEMYRVHVQQLCPSCLLQIVREVKRIKKLECENRRAQCLWQTLLAWGVEGWAGPPSFLDRIWFGHVWCFVALSGCSLNSRAAAPRQGVQAAVCEVSPGQAP